MDKKEMKLQDLTLFFEVRSLQKVRTNKDFVAKKNVKTDNLI